MAGKKEPSQKDKFIKLARELECDESEENFDRKMRKILSHKPAKKSQSHTKKDKT